MDSSKNLEQLEAFEATLLQMIVGFPRIADAVHSRFQEVVDSGPQAHLYVLEVTPEFNVAVDTFLDLYFRAWFRLLATYYRKPIVASREHPLAVFVRPVELGPRPQRFEVSLAYYQIGEPPVVCVPL